MSNVDINVKLARGNFAADISDIEALARAVHTGSAANGTYLKALVAACIARMAKGRKRVDAAEQEATVNVVHGEFYQAVMRGIDMGDSPDKLEQARRGAFARSAASTLRAYARSGADIRSLDAVTVTKAYLREKVKPPSVEDKIETAFRRSQSTLVSSIEALAEEQPEMARVHIEATMDALQALLDALPEDDSPRVVGHTLRRAQAKPAPTHRYPATGRQLHG